MQKYDVTLTLSKKHIPIYADSYEKAMAQIGDMVAGLVLMDFREEEIERITVNTAGSPAESGAVQKPDKPMKYSHLSPDMDKLCETLESLCNGFDGVDSAYAVQAGREVRILVQPEKIGDDQVILLARSIAKKIEDELDYPGQIKVSVIRESRATEYAK